LRPQGVEHRAVDNAQRLWSARRRQNEGVAVLRQFENGGGEAIGDVVERLHVRIGDLRPEGLGALRDGPADASEAEDPNPQSRDLATEREGRPGTPATVADKPVSFAESAGAGEKERHGEI